MATTTPSTRFSSIGPHQESSVGSDPYDIPSPITTANMNIHNSQHPAPIDRITPYLRDQNQVNKERLFPLFFKNTTKH